MYRWRRFIARCKSRLASWFTWCWRLPSWKLTKMKTCSSLCSFSSSKFKFYRILSEIIICLPNKKFYMRLALAKYQILFMVKWCIERKQIISWVSYHAKTWQRIRSVRRLHDKSRSKGQSNGTWSNSILPVHPTFLISLFSSCPLAQCSHSKSWPSSSTLSPSTRNFQTSWTDLWGWGTCKFPPAGIPSCWSFLPSFDRTYRWDRTFRSRKGTQSWTLSWWILTVRRFCQHRCNWGRIKRRRKWVFWGWC